MTPGQFWSILEKVHRESGSDIDKRFEVLETALAELSLSEVQSFDAHFTDCRDRAYTWGLWGAAYVMGGGCSDDKFWDFRSTLITCGRNIFSGEVAVRLGGDVLDDSKPHPKKPSGKRWDESNLATLYPRLTKKYKSGDQEMC